ncbi:Las1-like-domain-containing protein [Papiliotrema laurentii]|uniref:Las1-like-domain-containing protein n=1 Tax=Papiliotrema laurentii TaxID=5418 RepID=A0AAD9FT30_PAPLA|nr:Las1-like-domain-containing protein [Papiliotrema laurentii]
MKAPRRVPWASRSQLEELYDYLFSPASDLASRQRGLCRINVYLSSPSCPAFLPLLHGLINASLLPPPTSAGEAMTTRMTCAMAIVRFVNGMVDPLQVGAYARPISHLAATIGIPPILIAIRHRATHDDLPPLPLLLSSVNMAVDYLHHYAFLPLLASSSDMAANGIVGPSTRRSEGLIRRWKKAMKTRVRDKVAGEENETGREIRKVKRDIEVVDPEDVIAALCTVDGLIPLARRKRPGVKTTTPPVTSLQVWTPLLEHLATEHPAFPSLLAEHIMRLLLDPTVALSHVPQSAQLDPELAKREEESARWCLATWLLWLWAQDGKMCLADDDKATHTRRLLGALLRGDPSVRRLHRCLALIDARLSDSTALNDLLPEEEVSEDELVGFEEGTKQDDPEAKVAEMERRLRMIEQGQRSSVAQYTSGFKPTSGTDNLPTGWTRSGPEWKPCPIGIWASA